tara:strand:+ start:9678 stop:10610 length:933 start_codon:yes stop_codon:yes gene_type:complete
MNFDKIPSRQDLEELYHKANMRGVDNNISYTTDGEFVVPKPVMEKFPAMAAGIMQATAQEGLDPEQYLVGSDKGVYNPETGAQEFGHVWYHFELDDLQKTISNVGKSLVDNVKKNYDEFLEAPLDNRVVQGSLAALGSGAVAKLAGASNDQAIQTAIGGGLAYGALPSSTKKNPITTADRVFAGLAGAYGAYSGYQPPLEDEPIQGANNPVPTNYADILDTAPVAGFDQNEQANVSLGLPSKVAPAPFTSMDETPDGVNYKRKVKDRKTGAFNYVDSAPTSSFGRNVNTEGRRGGLSKGFGSKVLYIDDQ